MLHCSITAFAFSELTTGLGRRAAWLGLEPDEPGDRRAGEAGWVADRPELIDVNESSPLVCNMERSRLPTQR